MGEVSKLVDVLYKIRQAKMLPWMFEIAEIFYILPGDEFE
jgi:hypothetical protein